MEFIDSQYNKKLSTLRYLRDELLNTKLLSPKGERRLQELEKEIQHLEEKIGIPAYREIA